MNSVKKVSFSFLFVGLTALAGCSGVDYEVTGEISSPQTISGPLSLEIFEIDTANEEAARELVKQVDLEGTGPFTESFSAGENFDIVLVALHDEDGDGQCTEGEAWAEQTLTPAEDGSLSEVSLVLAAQACPASE